MEKANQTVHFSQPPHGQTAVAEGSRQHEAEKKPFGVGLNVREPGSGFVPGYYGRLSLN